MSKYNPGDVLTVLIASSWRCMLGGELFQMQEGDLVVLSDESTASESEEWDMYYVLHMSGRKVPVSEYWLNHSDFFMLNTIE